MLRGASWRGTVFAMSDEERANLIVALENLAKGCGDTAAMLRDGTGEEYLLAMEPLFALLLSKMQAYRLRHEVVEVR